MSSLGARNERNQTMWKWFIGDWLRSWSPTIDSQLDKSRKWKEWTNGPKTRKDSRAGRAMRFPVQFAAETMTAVVVASFYFLGRFSVQFWGHDTRKPFPPHFWISSGRRAVARTAPPSYRPPARPLSRRLISHRNWISRTTLADHPYNGAHTHTHTGARDNKRS